MAALCSSCVNLLPPPDDVAFLRTAHAIFVQFSKYPEALALAIRLGEPALISQDFHAPANPYVMARNRTEYVIKVTCPTPF